MGRHQLCASVLIAALLSGCGNRQENPVGSDLITRAQGRVVELPLLPSRGGSTRFEGTFGRAFGESDTLMVGRMGGLVLRSLIRVRLNPDSLISAAGAGVATLNVQTVQLRIWKREPTRGLEQLQVHLPEQAWSELDAFADTLNHTAVQFASSVIDGATAQSLGDSLIQIDLPPEYLISNMREDPQGGSVELLLQPAAGSRFFTSLVSRDDNLPENVNRMPELRLTYSMGGNTFTHVANVSADTYWAARDGPEPGMLVLATIVRLSPVFRFDLPDSIPRGATITSSELWLNYDRSQSMFGKLTFSVERININSATDDTTFSLVNSWRFDEQKASYAIDQTVVQGWLSGTTRNLGLALSTPITDRENWDVNWVVFHNPMLKLIYSTPPDP
ncbi:MAG: hypothetical protein J4F39_08490 [Candidatus Latescibacteria bacterium]|nr:hypothetical protein [Candidatus Latescibacterota bacterium]